MVNVQLTTQKTEDDVLRDKIAKYDAKLRARVASGTADANDLTLLGMLEAGYSMFGKP